MISILKKIVKNDNFLSLLSNIVVAAFGFFSIVILTRSLTKSVFGEWMLYITASNFIEMLRFGITRIALIRFLSGAKENERKELIGSNWLISLIATFIIVVIIVITRLSFPDTITQSGFSLFFKWYPVLAFLNLPFNNAQSILQADQKFDKILYIRSFNSGSFLIFIILNFFFFKYGIQQIIYAHLIFNFLTSVICMIYKMDGINYLFKATRKTNKMILNFGKYTTGTLIGSNLLKSSDTFIIGLSPFLGTTGVALYSIPLKLTELIEIPLRSFVATAFPRMSKASIENNITKVKKIYYTYSGATFLLLIPIIIICLIFAEKFVVILGGAKYVGTADIFRVFCIYGLFIPIDKFTGVALDSINKPKDNFYKIIYMTTANIIGDLIAVFGLRLIFPQLNTITILLFVSIVTIAMIIIGLFIGIKYLNKEININYKDIFLHGWDFYKTKFNNFSKIHFK